MPIDYKKYPPNWKTEIVPKVKERDNNCCAFCGVENYSVYFVENGERIYLQPSKEMAHFYVCPDGGKRMVGRTGFWHLKKIVLTVAHLDHDITNNDLSNLKALCQKCHLNYDKDYHRINSRQTLKKKKGIVELTFTNN